MTDTTNIVDIASGSEDFNILTTALTAANLVQTVRDLTDITVFAPTDAAFADLAAGLGYTGDPTDETAVFDAIAAALGELGDANQLLTDILLYHVSPEVKSEAAIEAAGTFSTQLAGATISFADGALVDNAPEFENPQIVQANVPASNGIIQGIDKVLLPLDVPLVEPELENIVDIAAGSDDFDILVNALTTADLAETVRASDDITVFAPTDAAFVALAQDLGYTGDPADEGAVFAAIAEALGTLGDATALLTDILLYHVSGGAKSQAEIEAAGTVETLLDGSSFTVDNGALVDAEPDLTDPTIAISDIPASNGTIQAIDRVLIPLDIPGNEAPEPTEPPVGDVPTIAGVVAASGGVFDADGADFDLLLNAVQAAGLVETLDAPGADLTVFAPNDAAFVGLAQALGFGGSDEAGAFGYIVDALELLNGGGSPIDLLTTILTYHVAPGTRDATSVLGSTTIPTVAGINLGVDGATLVDGDPDIPNPNIIATDVPASNGIVHVLDGVLIPIDVLQSDGANDVDFLIGDDTNNDFDTGADADLVSGKGGDDDFEGGAGNDLFVGGAGLDTSDYDGAASSFSVMIADDSVMVLDRSGAEGTDTLVGVEALEFGDDFGFGDDDSVDLTLLQDAANLSEAQLTSIVELYIAYFDRAPDALGLYYWGTELANGKPLGEIAASFFEQPESMAIMPPEGDNGALVDLAYQNVLERAAEPEGRDYWIDALDSGDVSRPEFMLAIINGAKAATGSPADAQVIADKVDIGLAYSAIAGLTDVEDAGAAVDAYDRDDAATSLATADALIDGFVAEGDAFTASLVGVVDDPFAIA